MFGKYSFKENNENDMAAHGICFDFYYQPKLSQIGENGLAAAASAHLAGSSDAQQLVIIIRQ